MTVLTSLCCLLLFYFIAKLFTWFVSNLAFEEDTEPGLKIDSLARQVEFASLNTLRQLQGSSTCFKNILWGTVHPAGDQLKRGIFCWTVDHRVLSGSQADQKDGHGTPVCY